MKPNTILPTVAALLGSLITGGALIGAEIIQQQYENTLRLQMMAYEMAMKEWEMRASKVQGAELPDFGDILLEHIEHSYVARKYGPDQESEKYAGIILDKKVEDRILRKIQSISESENEENAKGRKSTSQDKANSERLPGSKTH